MKKLYDGLVEFFAGQSWGEFIAQGTRAGKPENAVRVQLIFQQDSYLYAFIILVLITLLATIYYYFMLNKKHGSGYGYKLKYWLITLLVSEIFVGFITVLMAAQATGKFSDLHPFRFSMALGVVNIIYGAILFLIFSVLFKRFSIANRTPF